MTRRRVSGWAHDRAIGVPLYMAPGQALDDIRAAASRIGGDPVERVIRARESQSRSAGTDPELELGAGSPEASVFLLVGDGPDREDTQDGIAIVRVVGSLYRGMFWDDYRRLRGYVTRALEDAQIRAVLLEIDSPGGSVCGLFDCARALREASLAAEKPVWAIANMQATSAAYAIAAAADRVYAAPAALIGGIGSLFVHLDRSERDREMGLRWTEIASGERKTDLSTHRPLNAEGRASLQSLVDAAAAELFTVLSELRSGLSVDGLRALEAACFVGREALEPGLIDGVAHLDAVLTELRTALDASPSSPGGLPAYFPSAGSAPAGVHMSTSANSPNVPTPAAPAAAPAASAATAAAPAGATPAAPTAPSTAAPAPAAATPTAPSAEAAPADASAEAYRAEAQRIVNACTLAGRADLAGQCIARGMSVDAVQAWLLELRAGTDGGVDAEINGRHTHAGPSADPATQVRVPDASSVYRRWNDIEALQKPAALK